MKKTFYETLWSLLEKQGILQKWFDEGLLVTRKNTTYWTPKALEILGLQESIGGVNLSDEPGGKPKEVELTAVDLDFLNQYVIKFNHKNLGVAGKGGNLKAITKKMTDFLKEYDYTHSEILKAVDMYIENLRKTNSLPYVQEAHYFISKLDTGKNPISNLAKWCDEVRTGNGNKGYTSHNVL